MVRTFRVTSERNTIQIGTGKRGIFLANGIIPWKLKISSWANGNEDLPGSTHVKNPPTNAGDMRCGFDPWVRKITWRKAWQYTPVFLPGESNGQSFLVGCSSWGCKESDMTELI